MADLADDDQKRQYGSYYTSSSPFDTVPFQQWARNAGIAHRTVLEPFAGSNSIVSMLRDSGMCSEFACYDIATGRDGPDGAAAAAAGTAIRRRDTLRSFPSGHDICITNPPWLARNSARRRGLAFDVPPRYDDMYKYALELALANCRFVAFIIPATFIRAGLFRDRLESFVLLERAMFSDTENPVCLALFVPEPRRATVWADSTRLGHLDALEAKYRIPVGSAAPGRRVRFNAPGGMLGLRAVDDTYSDSIRFCHGSELDTRTVKRTDRAISRIDPGAQVTHEMIRGLNNMLAEFRRETHDVFLAPFKGLRADGRYRRRLDFATARGLISRYLQGNRPGQTRLA